MKKINNKSTNYSLKILVILAFMLIFLPFKASAQQVCGSGGCNTIFGANPNSNPYYSYNNQYYNNTPSYYYQPPVVYTPPPAPAPTPVPTPTIYSNSSNSGTATTTKTVATATKNTTSSTNSYSALTANAVYGSNGFWPSGLVQWVLFAIIILLLVILGRRVFGAKGKYELSPLKHD